MSSILGNQVRQGVINKWNAVGQSIAMNGPAATLSLYLVAIAEMAGYHLSLILIISFILYAMMTYMVFQWSSETDSTAPWAVYVEKGLGKGAGFVAGLIYWLYYIIGFSGFALLGLSSFLSYFSTFNNFKYAWILIILVMSIEAVIISLKKIEISTKYFIYVGLFEVLFLVATSFYLIIKFHQNIPSLFNLNISGTSWTSIILGVGAFGGISGLAPLVRETKDFKREIPSALLISLFLIGGTIIIGSIGQSLAMGPDGMNNYYMIQDPGLFIYLHFIGSTFYLILILLVINSFNSSLLATSNNFTRMLHGISERFNYFRTVRNNVNKNGIPYIGLYFGIIIGSSIAIITGFVFSPIVGSIFLLVMAAFFSYTVHILVSISLMRRRVKKSIISIIKYGLLPALVSLFLIVASYFSIFIYSVYPYNYAILIALVYILSLALYYSLFGRSK